MIQKSYCIPKTFHCIWVGGKIPDEYIDHIRYFSGICKISDYQLNIWVDTSSYFENRDDLYNIPDLSIHKTESILQQLIDDPADDYTDEEKAHFIKSIYFEYLQPPNYAAVSDFLRIEILRQHGGIYIDMDTMLRSYKKQTEIILSIDFSILHKIGIGHAERNNNLIIASQNHPALIACTKRMIKKMTESHSLSETDYLKVLKNEKYGKKPPNKDIEKYFKDEHCWRIAKKSLHIMPYHDIGHELDSYATDRYHHTLLTGKLLYAPLRWHFTLIIGPESLHKTVISWQNFLEDHHILSIYECCTLMLPWESLFNTKRCDSAWCEKDSFVYPDQLQSIYTKENSTEKSDLNNTISVFEERVLPLTFSDLPQRLHHFPDHFLNESETKTLENKRPGA